MKLAEMEKLPERAGLAQLEFESETEELELPVRINNKIILPDIQESDFFSLQEGTQFLLIINLPQFLYRAWFGGTDERPFLVALEDDIIEIFEKEGEKGFYKALKPDFIKEIERAFNVDSLRQGDIWAVPIPFNWEQLKMLGGIICCISCWEDTNSDPVKEESLFETRHLLTGRRSCDLEYYEDISEKSFILAEGTITAPDHSPLKLKGVHVLVQTEYLHDPTAAD